MKKGVAMDRRRSTLLFIHASADLYGSDVTLLQLVSHLNQDKFRCIVVLPYEGLLVPFLREAGAEVIICPDLPILRRQHMSIKGLLHLVSSFGAVRRLVDLIRRRDVDLVHSNTLAVLLPGFAALMARCPQVWHVHEITTSPRLVASLLSTLTSALSTLVVANSRATAEHYRHTRFLGSTPVEVILNGIDESRLRGPFETTVRSSVGAGPKDVVFTLVGRINSWKGHSVFLDAAEQLAGELENVRFLVVGDSFVGQERLSQAVDKRIATSERLNKRMAHLAHVVEVGSVYAASDVVVVPSIEPEPFGLVAAEAMAAGLPVIASRIGALPEIVEDRRTGLLVEPNDAASLLAAMREVGKSPERRDEMGRQGRDRFERDFRVERYVEQFGQVYEKLLANV